MVCMWLIRVVKVLCGTCNKAIFGFISVLTEFNSLPDLLGVPATFPISKNSFQ